MINKWSEERVKYYYYRPRVRQDTSALTGYPDLNSRVYWYTKPVLRTVRVCSHGLPTLVSQVLAGVRGLDFVSWSKEKGAARRPERLEKPRQSELDAKWLYQTLGVGGWAEKKERLE